MNSFKDKYKESFSSITPSDELLNNTLNKMLEESKIESASKQYHTSYTKIKSKNTKTLIMAACFLFILITVPFAFKFINTDSIEIKTSLTNSSSPETYVELSNNNILNFSMVNENSISLDLNFGATNTEKREITESDFTKHLPYNPISEYLSKNYNDVTAHNQKIVFDLDNNKFISSFKYKFVAKDNSEITLFVAKDRIPKESTIHKNNSINSSTIKDVNLKLCYREVEKNNYEYTGEFIINKIGYVIESKNISQEEFIKIILSIVTQN